MALGQSIDLPSSFGRVPSGPVFVPRIRGGGQPRGRPRRFGPADGPAARTSLERHNLIAPP